MNYVLLALKYKWVIGIVTLAVSTYAVLDHYESKGYDRAISEMRVATIEKIQEATNKTIAQAAVKLQEALDRQQTTFDNELKRVKDERVVEYITNEIIEYVDRVVISTNCAITNDSIIKLLNDSVNTSNAASIRAASGGK